MDLKKLYQSILKVQVASQFEQEGFTIKSLNRYTRTVNGTVQEFSVYGRSVKGNPHKSFTFELCLYANGIPEDDVSPDFYYRLGRIQRGTDNWYCLNEDNHEQLGELVALDIKQFAIPFFNGISNKNDIDQLVMLCKKVKDPMLLPLALTELFPGMGRNYEKEFLHIWKQTIGPLAVTAGFVEMGNVFYRFVGNEVAQAFHFQCWMTDTQTFMNLEGMLSLFVKDPRQEEIPALYQPSSGWIHIPSAYVITGKPRSYNRYTLADYTPAQMQRLIADDWQAFFLPFFERLTVPEAINDLWQQISKNRQ